MSFDSQPGVDAQARCTMALARRGTTKVRGLGSARVTRPSILFHRDECMNTALASTEGEGRKKNQKKKIERSCSAKGPPQMCTVGTDRVGCEKKIRGGRGGPRASRCRIHTGPDGRSNHLLTGAECRFLLHARAGLSYTRTLQSVWVRLDACIQPDRAH